jgi:hypothetical protein
MFLGIIRQTIMITSLVLIMMLIIEYFNVISHGNWGKSVYQSKFKQVLFASLLGLVPGCIGGFAAVSMFTHKLLNFGALVANMIASLGDESFVIFSMMPKTAVILNLSVFAIAILAGLVINLVMKSAPAVPVSDNHMVIHQHEIDKSVLSLNTLKNNIRNMSFQRAILIMGLLLFLFGVFTGQFEHGIFEIPGIHGEHEHSDTHGSLESIIFSGLAVFTLFILVRVDQHFLEEHIWEHIIKKHFIRIFLWTFGALLIIHFLVNEMDITPWLHKNQIIVLLVAVLIGIIPESGPHLLFVTLYFNAGIPFSILLANSIVQDGHSALPLLAESKKSFLWVKGINSTIALLFGFIGYYMGW